jgi:hypothetical protein
MALLEIEWIRVWTDTEDQDIEQNTQRWLHMRLYGNVLRTFLYKYWWTINRKGRLMLREVAKNLNQKVETQLIKLIAVPA